jgi:hypothetical protein
MDTGDPANNKQSPFRWDASTAACVLVLAALAFLFYVKVAARGSVGGSVSVGR